MKLVTENFFLEFVAVKRPTERLTKRYHTDKTPVFEKKVCITNHFVTKTSLFFFWKVNVVLRYIKGFMLFIGDLRILNVKQCI